MESMAGLFLQSLSILSRTRAGYKDSVDMSLFQRALPLLWSIKDVFGRFWAFQCLNALVSGRSERDMESEYVNKTVIAKTGSDVLLPAVIAVFSQEPREHDSQLHVMSACDVLLSVLCLHHSTTPPEFFAAAVNMLEKKCRDLFFFLQTGDLLIAESVAVLLDILLRRSPSSGGNIHEEALSSGALLIHFHAAIFSHNERRRYLGRYLCSQWLSGPPESDSKRLLRRMLPSGFQAYLKMPQLSPEEALQLDDIENDLYADREHASNNTSFEVKRKGFSKAAHDRLRRHVQVVQSFHKTENDAPANGENFRIFFHVLTQDHSMADLIWTQQTRHELRVALEAQIDSIAKARRNSRQALAWNFQHFRVSYQSLEDEIKVGSIYMRLWLKAGDAFVRSWDDPLRLFEQLVRRLLCEMNRSSKVANMCIRCLQRLYAISGSSIGPCIDVPYLVDAMASTRHLETQHLLLDLIATLIGVDAYTDKTDSFAFDENAEQLLTSSSIGILCHFLSWCHAEIHYDGLQDVSMKDDVSDLASSAANGDISPRVWFVSRSNRVPPPGESIDGPFRVDQIVCQAQAGLLSQFDLVAASVVEGYDFAESEHDDTVDTGKWQRFDDVKQFRWLICMDKESKRIYSREELAIRATKCLARVVEAHRDVNAQGIAYFPLPTAKRLLSVMGKDSAEAIDIGAAPFAILVQALLCENATLADEIAVLLLRLAHCNEACVAKWYLSGLFFFVLRYKGNNFGKLAKILHVTHVRQEFCTGADAARIESADSLCERSVLGFLLPHGLVWVLESYGPERFAEIFVGAADNPEVVWNQEMRSHLIEMIDQHLGDFPSRLVQQITLQYEYCPMPPVTYDALKSEIFCHRYYIRRLFEDSRFEDWPIDAPIEVFRGSVCLLLAAQQSKLPLSSLAEALALFNLSSNPDCRDLRRAYRRLARLYHPDKNPSGRMMFDKVQDSYEFLLYFGDNAGRDSGSISSTQTLMRSQILLRRRFPKQFKGRTYPAYDVVVDELTLDEDIKVVLLDGDLQALCASRMFKLEVFRRYATCVDLLRETCAMSRVNSEEIVRANGVAPLLDHFLCQLFYLKHCVAQADGCDVGTVGSLEVERALFSTMSTLSGIFHHPLGCEALFASRHRNDFLSGWCRCLFPKHEGEFFRPEVRLSALEGVQSVSQNPELCDYIVACGTVWKLFDCMLDDNDATSDRSVAESAAKTLNVLAECNAEVDAAIKRLLPTSVHSMIRSKHASEAIETLTSDVERPDLIWNAQMMCSLKQEICHIEARRPTAVTSSAGDEMSLAATCEYDAIKSELKIDGVFLRPFIKGGAESMKHVSNPTRFAVALIAYLGDNIETGSKIRAFSEGATMVSVAEALLIVVHENDMMNNIIHACPATASTMLRVLGCPTFSKFFDVCTRALLIAFRNQDFAKLVSVADLSGIFRILANPAEYDKKGEGISISDSNVESKDVLMKRKWSVLESLCCSSAVVEKIVEHGHWLSLLGVVVGITGIANNWVGRVGAATALTRVLSDPRFSSTGRVLLGKFLPDALIDLLKRSPEAMVRLFDHETESPELIWRSLMRSQLRSTISPTVQTILNDSGQGATVNFWEIPDVKYNELDNETCIGGVFLSRFLDDPSCALRDPEAFLEALLKWWLGSIGRQCEGFDQKEHASDVKSLAKTSDQLEQVTSAIVLLCKHHLALAPKLGSWGYIEKSLSLLLSAPGSTALRVIHGASSCGGNVERMASWKGSTKSCTSFVALMKAIMGDATLHYDSALIAEILFNSFNVALGDVAAVRKPAHPLPSSYAAAPSPAPGEGPVRKKVSADEDPLALLSDAAGGTSNDFKKRQPTELDKVAHTRNVAGDNAQAMKKASLHSQVSTMATNGIPSSHASYAPFYNNVSFRQQHLPFALRSDRDQTAQTGLPGCHRSPLQNGQLISQEQQSTFYAQHPVAAPPYYGQSQYPGAAQWDNVQANRMLQQKPEHNGTHDNFDIPITKTTVQFYQDAPPRRQQEIHDPTPLANDAFSDHSARREPTAYGPIHRSPGNPLTSPICTNVHDGYHAERLEARKMLSNTSTGESSRQLLHPNQTARSQAQDAVAGTLEHQNQFASNDGARHNLQWSSITTPDSTNTAVIDARTPEPPATLAERRQSSHGGAPDSIPSRVQLLEQALACSLCDYLVHNVLESASLANVKDPVATKLHVIALLKLLCRDPGYGASFTLILDDMPAWRKYKMQRHDLLVTDDQSQRGGYFLTQVASNGFDGTGQRERLRSGHGPT